MDTKTPEELYALALEEDTLVIYSTTTRMYDVKDSFEKQYPGLTVELHDIRAFDLVEMMKKTDYAFCDIIVSSDDDGSLTAELYNNGIIHKYVPYDMKHSLKEEEGNGLLAFVGEAEQLFYNTEIFETSPIQNWWELTQEEWKGKICMKNPLSSYPTYGLVSAILNNHEIMAQAYYNYYGVELAESDRAGEIFLERLFKNDIKLTTSSNEVVAMISNTEDESPMVGFMISSKIRKNEIGMNIAPAYGIEPWDGVYSENTISILNNAPNINTAKLFIRWVLGETDGKGEGIVPFTTEGTISVRNDVNFEVQGDMIESNLYNSDVLDVIDSNDYVKSFLTTLMEECLE